MPGLKCVYSPIKSLSELSPEEKTAFQYLFKKADTDGIGVVTGDKAVPFFSHSNLPPYLLGEIWQMSDDDNKGFLTEDGFFLACRLIGHAQSGSKPSASIARQQGPPPRFDNVTIPGIRAQSPLPSSSAFQTMHALVPQSTGTASSKPIPSPIAAQHTGTRPASTLQAQYTGSRGVNATVSPAERAQYSRLFQSAGPLMGLLDGDKARDIFIKSKLPVDKLGQIWTLADTRARGSLDQTDFILAMYFIQGLMDGKLSSVPATLPPGLYESASGGTSLPLSAQPQSPTRAGSVMVPPSPIRPVSTGGGGFGAGAGAFGGMGGAAEWGVSQVERQTFGKYFEGLDTARRGYIEGDVAVPFFRESGLDNNLLAKVWELSSMSKEGALTADEFAVAMKLITDKLNGKEIPDTLPSNLIPPSNRQAAPMLSGPQQDLLSLMDEPPVSPPAAQVTQPPYLSPQHTAASATFNRVASPPTSHISAPPPIPAPRQTASPVPPPIPSHTPRQVEDLFGDSFENKSSISNDGAMLGNMKNQLESTQRSLERVQAERSVEDPKVMSNEGMIADLTNRLKKAKEQFEIENKRLEDTRKRVSEQMTEMEGLRKELITAESGLSAVKEERNELEQGLMRDKEEIRLMKVRMSEAVEETKRLRTQMESVSKEARLQKGLVAITKKQLDTAEGEKEKAREGLGDAERELEEAKAAVKEHEAMATPERIDSMSPTAVALPKSNSGSIVASPSPAPSTKSTNPFDRLAFGNNAGSRTASPFPTEHVEAPAPSVTSFADAFAIPSEPEPAPPAPPAATTEESKEDDDEDPFGVDEPAADTHAKAASSFDDAFGVSTSPAAQGKDDFTSAFDDAFGSEPMKPLQQKAPEPPKDTEANDFASAFPDISSPVTTGPAGFADAFGASAFPDISKAAAVEDKGKGKEQENEDSDGDLRPIKDVEPDESDSSDDEEPESATHAKSNGAFATPPQSTTVDAPSTLPGISKVETSAPAFAVPPAFTPPPALTPTPAPAVAPTTTNPAPAPAADNGFDDFDEAFSDFPQVKAEDKNKADELQKKQEDEDWEASFKDFDALPRSSNAPSNDPFGASFDDAFGTSTSNNGFAPTHVTGGGSTGSAFTSSGFDDAFGSANYVPSAPPPKEPPPGTFDPNAAQADDAEAVKSIVSMGFTRNQALDALEKHNYDTQRAINSLLG
ncbi:hypothetical protein BT69DRAFT_1347876 [Atractiella rhizophila]|nr:hypothetical protein BT69DRAFT_1347876 [Atractiella rhizophila]